MKAMKPTASIYKAGSHLTFVLSNKAYTINKNDAHFERAVAAYAKGDWDTVLSFTDRPQYVVRWSEGRVKVVEDGVLLDDKPVTGYIVNRILEFVDKGLPIGPIVRFLENLQLAKAEHVKEDLYKFLELNDLPLTDDGGFLAYKLVNQDGTPFYQFGRKDIVYQVDKLMEMPYEECNSSRDECGGPSWYAANKHYWGGESMFNAKDEFVGIGKMFLVKIMPSWVVSVPVAESGRKLKCFKMLPIMEYAKGAKRQESHVKEVAPKELVLEGDTDKPVAKRDSYGRFSGGRKLAKPSFKRDNTGRFTKDSRTFGQKVVGLALPKRRATKSSAIVEKHRPILNKLKRDVNGRFI